MAWNRKPSNPSPELAIPRRKPKETGVRKKSPDKPWKKAERDAAKWLIEHDGHDPQTQHVASSTGRVGHLTHLQYDASSRKYKAEVKRRQSDWTASQRQAWKQICQVAASHPGYEPLYVLFDPGDGAESYYIVGGSRRRLPPMHCVTPTRHAELLRETEEAAQMASYLYETEQYEKYLHWRDTVDGMG